MEGTPHIPEQILDDMERQEKHIPKAETIGSVAVEKNPEKNSEVRQRSPEYLGHTLISKEALTDNYESSFEQDPALRHAQNQGAVSKVSSSIGSLLSNKSDLRLGSSADPSSASHKASQPKQSVSLKRQWSVADIAMISVICFLLLLIILVILLKS